MCLWFNSYNIIYFISTLKIIEGMKPQLIIVVDDVGQKYDAKYKLIKYIIHV